MRYSFLNFQSISIPTCFLRYMLLHDEQLLSKTLTKLNQCNLSCLRKRTKNILTKANSTSYSNRFSKVNAERDLKVKPSIFFRNFRLYSLK